MSGPVRLTTSAVDGTLAELMFPASQSGRPVYAVPDEQIMWAVAQQLGVPEKDAERLLRRTAALQIGLGTAEPPFAKLAQRAPSINNLDVPPGLTTLAVLSLAADRMHAAEGMGANNYYGRLHELLETPDEKKSAVERAYRDHAEDLWDHLNSWLESWEGERGIPTAYAVGQWRYVGLPLSQALVRRGDREKLTTVFVHEGLPPGYRMPPADMEATLDSWMSRSTPFFTHTLRTLWTDNSARERITAVACLELEAWDGTDLEDAGPSITTARRAVQLLVTLRRFPRTSLELDLRVPVQGTDTRALVVNGATGPTEVQLGSPLVGAARLQDTHSIDFGSLLTDELAARSTAGALYRRRPRRVVPMRFDELQQAWVEQESAQLGETTLLLAADTLDERICELLSKVARPGWGQLPRDTPGVPVGWSVFHDVQLMDRAGGVVHLDLQPLLPRASVSLVLSGGLVLPGPLRKWSSLDPPEIHATSAAADSITVEVHRGTRVGDVVIKESVEGGVLLVDLSGRGLEDGEYLITVSTDGSSKPSATALMRLRSSRAPAIRRGPSRLVLGPESGPLWPLTASAQPDHPGIDGARVTLRPESFEPATPMPEPVERPRITRAVNPNRAVRIGLGLGTDSCMRNGMHRMKIPTDVGGKPVSRSVEGVCSTCGLIKRYPTTAAGAVARKKAKSKKVWTPPNLADVPPIRAVDGGAWFSVFDALCHLGSGTVGALARLAGQMDGTSLGIDILTRNLEALGHVDLARDPRTLQVTEWEITPSTLARTHRKKWILVGRRTPDQVRQLADLVSYSSGQLCVELDGQVPRVEITLDPEPLAEIVSVLSDDWPDLITQDDPASRIAAALPTLGSLTNGLTRVPVPAVSSIEAWDTTSASWVRDTSIEHPGAFRITHHSRNYVLRDERDLADGTVKLANAQLSKHLANLWVSDPLARYDTSTQSVIVPLGADLPGLYARALVLASGRLPIVHNDVRVLQYPEVDPRLANLVHDRLTH